MKKTLFARGLAASLLLLAFCGSLLAQGTAPALPICEAAVKTASVDAQAKANAECRTIYYCVECMDKISGAKTCRPVSAYPVCEKSVQVVPMKMKTTAAVSASMDMAESVPAPAEPFDVIIVQSICYSSGVTIEPYVTGKESMEAKDRLSGYTFSWTLDGKPMGKATRLECVSGKMAILTATENATKKTVTKNIKLPEAGGNGEAARSKVPAPTGGGITVGGTVVAAFKKTSCYGTCPAYEVKFYSNGTASWDGYMHIERMGHFELTLDPNVLGRIQEKAATSKFFDLASKYPTNFTIADAPSTITYVKSATREKQVENILEAPQNLIDFENFLAAEIVQMGWAPTPPKKPSVKAASATEDPKH